MIIELFLLLYIIYATFKFENYVLVVVMVLLGLLGDVHKVNCTWNLKAIDEFQSLLIFAGQVESRFSFQSTEFHKSR